MFVVDGAPGDPESLARLSRLMFNIERGEKVYGWDSESDEKPLDGKPEPGFISIEIPGVTRDAQPVTVDYRPSVGFVYYSPSTKHNWFELLVRLQTLMDNFPDDHLRGYLQVETTPHVSLLQRGHFHSGSDVLGGGSVVTEEWASSERPARFFKMGARDLSDSVPPQSLQGAFTWCVAPISAFTQITEYRSFGDFNSAVASVFLNTTGMPLESPEPILKYSPELFGIEPLPEELDGVDKMSWILVVNRGRFDVVGRTGEMCQTLCGWVDPESTVCTKQEHPREDKKSPLTIPNLPGRSDTLESKCGVCTAPLWGDVYAVTSERIAPNHMAVCRWCCGCFPLSLRDSAIKVSAGRTQAEAFKDTRLAPLLGAEVEVLRTRAQVYAFATLENGKKLVVSAGNHTIGEWASPPCFNDPEVADRHVSHLQWVDIAIVT